MKNLLSIIALLTIFACTANSKDSITRIPPSDGPAKYPQDFRVIGGVEVPQGDAKYSSVIRISTDGASCTASIVGPQAILTAAHCGKTDAVSSFKIGGKDYQATLTRSLLYPGVDHDLALGLVSEKIENVQYEQISAASINQGDTITMYGYGCIQPGGGGGNDGILRYGDSVVNSFSAKDFVTKKPDGAALCFGDSGGPSFDKDGFQVGVASKGNISDTSYFANLAIQESQEFLKKWATENAVDVCGINKDCQGPQPETITIASESLGTMEMKLKPETIPKDYVEHHMQMLMEFLEYSLESGKLDSGIEYK